MQRIRALAFLFIGLGAAPARAMPPDFVRLSDIAPEIRQDMRYAGTNNFTGRPVPGYDSPVCWLRTEAAKALAAVAKSAEIEGFHLVVWDCYRPKQATSAFLRWSADLEDQTRKDDFYPRVPKKELFGRGYIGRQSGHSTGYAVDVGLLTLDDGTVDFGSAFDLFDTRSATASMEVNAVGRTNRARLAALMSRKGFRNYTREWWHYSLPDMPTTAFDAPLEP